MRPFKSLQDLFTVPSEEEYLDFKSNQHRQMMDQAYQTDQNLKDFPYIDHIPYVCIHNER